MCGGGSQPIRAAWIEIFYSVLQEAKITPVAAHSGCVD